jgi:ribose-phosphate pyrophosphokinase
MIVIPGPASSLLGEAIAKELGQEPTLLSHRLFPDGESYIRFPGSVEGETVVLVQTTAPDQDRKLLQLMFMARNANDMGASRIIAVIPYLAYARQDKRFLNGEAVAFEIILDLLESAGVTDTILVDIHNEHALEKLKAKYTMKIHNLTAVFVLADYLKQSTYEGAYSLAPDLGRAEIVERVSKVMGGGFAYFMKVRDRYTGKTTMKVKNLDLMGKDVVIFDDIISSGGTMARAIQGLKYQGARRVAAVCTHALPVPGASEKLRNAGADKIVATDTVESVYETVSIAKLVADFLKTI